ncbi:uncharacterized protein LOC115743349 isoform X2 [Rhodamnia argentea]|uniref:Uncharacterized protein LOC115743349 isoform X2 n=1 Tax=Rhodamnia argentea TaxID=178133 RepID=A0ABM3HL64_9MYRT|nr:uncharacterized protein LOC115743349 isoform X2 [Rhodamnia argentea]
MWRAARSVCSFRGARRLSAAARRRIDDEGDWFYSSEWWGSTAAGGGGGDGHTVLRATSDRGNGVVSVVAFPSSRPNVVYWSSVENWLLQRYADIYPRSDPNERFRVLGYQWRVLRFNDDTRQSTVKIMATYRESEPHSVRFMQQANCLAVPYLKSMVSAGLATLASSDFDLGDVLCGNKPMNILCIGHGGGSLPLFLASKIQGAIIDIVEIDPLVISASIQAMGFPAFSVLTPSGDRAISKPDLMDEVMWKGVHERLHLLESDAEKFVHENKKLYDLVFIDAYDGDDIFPRKLWDPDSPFLRALSNQLHSEHGAVVVNLHSDADLLSPDGSPLSVLQQLWPMGKHVSSIAQAYKDAVVGRGSSHRAHGEMLISRRL